MPAQTPRLIAAVDMGSSSFRMIVARVESPDGQPHVRIIDSLREPVRLAAGLDEAKNLSTEAQQRAFETLKRFSERLKHFHPDSVRAVATNTARVARNGVEFIRNAERALGFEIDVISGAEEARLIYSGVAHQLPTGLGRRLVVDIGGGSTEFIIGEDYDPLALESLYIGCVTSAQKHFSDGQITSKDMREAILAARREVVILRRQLTDLGWSQVIGSSGTARALSDLCIENGWASHGLNLQGLHAIKDNLIESGHVDRVSLKGMKEDRKHNIPGGLAIMLAVFEELELTDMEVTDGALRQGLLYDVLGRCGDHDRREATVEQFKKRWLIDERHADRVKNLTMQFFSEFVSSFVQLEPQAQLLAWAAELHEIGLSISHNGHHKHASYILGKSDMPGFSKKEQALLADWVLAHNGKLGKVQYLTDDIAHWAAPLCLRLAALFLRRRDPDHPAGLAIEPLLSGVNLKIDGPWLDAHPLTRYLLDTEVEQWKRIGLKLDVIESR